MSVAIYAGSFDPLTNGHLDIIDRALHTFKKVIVAVTDNPQKNHCFSVDERIHHIQTVLANTAGVEVDRFSGLLINYVQKKHCTVILRGLRAVSDFEYEFQLAHMNRNLDSTIETVFMMTGSEHFYVSSSLVREVASLGGDVSKLVPNFVLKELQQRFARNT